jgi:CRISPR-associated endoribonuclease Cas6
MRLKILLEMERPTLIPWDYRTFLTRAIYDILAYSDKEYSRWLHDEGFKRDNKVYRLFVYSDLQLWRWESQKEGLCASYWMSWLVASPDLRFIEKFMDGLRKKETIELFQDSFKVVDVLKLRHPSFPESLTSYTVSPVVVSTYNPGVSRYPIYLRPDQPEFVQALERNLIAKWEAFHGRGWSGEELKIRVWNPRKKLVRVFETNIQAWHLQAQLWGSEELIRFAYDAGLGEKNSQGFGMIEVGGKNARNSYSSRAGNSQI